MGKWGWGFWWWMEGRLGGVEQTTVSRELLERAERPPLFYLCFCVFGCEFVLFGLCDCWVCIVWFVGLFRFVLFCFVELIYYVSVLYIICSLHTVFSRDIPKN